MLFASLALASSLIAGHWDGTMVSHGQPIAVRFDFDAQGGRFTSEMQSAMDYPLDGVAVKDTHVHFVLGGGLIFDGVATKDAIAGTFAGSPQGAFTLHRTPAPILPYDVQDISFRNGSVELRGTLCLPRTPGKHGAVVLLQGSGAETRWGTNRYIADRFARAGIAALIYDKRGSGASSGDWRTASYRDLANDALAGVHLLAARADIDPAKIGLHGHSQGGVIAPLAATIAPRGAIAFLVAEDTFAGPQRDQDIYRVRNAIGELHLSPADRRDAMNVYTLFVDAARGARPVGEFEAASARYKTAKWYGWMDFPQRESWVWPWARLNGNFDTLPVWREVHVPVLLVYGEKDALVPVQESIDKIGAALDAAHAPHWSFVAPGAQHNLTIQPDPNGPFFWWRQAPGVIDRVVAWVEGQTR